MNSTVLTTIIEESFSYFKAPGGAIASALLKGVFERKAEEAREILFDEISQGMSPAMAEDDAVYIIYRYLRAAQEGTARINLRLLAQIISGKNIDETLTADKFLYYADIISSLRLEEIKLLGIIVREKVETAYSAKEALREYFSEEKSEEIFQSLLRTGLVIFYQEISVEDEDDHKQVRNGYRYKTDLYTDYHLTSLMCEICKTLSFEEALEKEFNKDKRGIK